LVGGIYTSDPEHLSMHATLPRFVEMERRYGCLWCGMRKASEKSAAEASASGARYGLFVSFPNGMQELLDALHSAITPDVEIHTNSPVTALSREGDPDAP